MSSAASEVLLANIDGRTHADAAEIAGKPCLGASAPDIVHVEQELPVGVELRGDAETLHHVLGIDRMDAHRLHLRAAHFAVLDHPANEGYRSHLAHERGVEAD